jgi:hypothetical protein
LVSKKRRSATNDRKNRIDETLHLAADKPEV